MTSFSDLKKELIKQKSAIEKKNGTVLVANTNPSPSEITAGIENIPAIDFTLTNATEEDVRQGKTFYSGNATIKTGSALMNQEEFIALFAYPDNTQSHEDKIYFTFPNHITKTRKYF